MTGGAWVVLLVWFLTIAAGVWQWAMVYRAGKRIVKKNAPKIIGSLLEEALDKSIAKYGTLGDPKEHRKG